MSAHTRIITDSKMGDPFIILIYLNSKLLKHPDKKPIAIEAAR